MINLYNYILHRFSVVISNIFIFKTVSVYNFLINFSIGKYKYSKYGIKLLNQDNFENTYKFCLGAAYGYYYSNYLKKIKKKFIFLDIGANIGIYSLYAATHKHNVISVEPEFSNFFMLNANIRDNNLAPNMTAYPISLYNKSEIAHLHIRYGTLGASSNSFEQPIGQTGELFDAIFKQGSISITTDQLLSKLNLQPNYIKIDVDGHELPIVEGMVKTLKLQSLQSILIELNTELPEHKQALEIVESNEIQWILSNQDQEETYQRAA